MARYPAPGYRYVIGPGGVSPAVKVLLIANIALFVVTELVPAWLGIEIKQLFGLTPRDVLSGYLWQPGTYMFLHADLFHILFNMLSLWMLGVDLERTWGTPFFVRYYAVTGIGAALTVIASALLPMEAAARTYQAVTIGASGAIFGLLLAYALYFPNRPFYFMFLFEVPAKYFVMILGAVALYWSIQQQGGVSHAAHLGGLIVGYLYLRGRRLSRFNPLAELKYRYLRWKIARMRKKFDVYSGGRSDDWDRRIH
jgi:membrane associated rhomboid family serine protease